MHIFVLQVLKLTSWLMAARLILVQILNESGVERPINGKEVVRVSEN